jgi:hypothetical protein
MEKMQTETCRLVTQQIANLFSVQVEPLVALCVSYVFDPTIDWLAENGKWRFVMEYLRPEDPDDGGAFFPWRTVSDETIGNPVHDIKCLGSYSLKLRSQPPTSNLKLSRDELLYRLGMSIPIGGHVVHVTLQCCDRKRQLSKTIARSGLFSSSDFDSLRDSKAFVFSLREPASSVNLKELYPSTRVESKPMLQFTGTMQLWFPLEVFSFFFVSELDLSFE